MGHNGPVGHGRHGTGLAAPPIQESLLPDALCELMMEAKAILQIAGTERCGYCKLSGGKLNSVLSCSVQYVAYYWFTKLSRLADGRFGVSTVELIAVKTSGLNASAATSAMAVALAERNNLDSTQVEIGPNRIDGKWDLETTRVSKKEGKENPSGT